MKGQEVLFSRQAKGIDSNCWETPPFLFKWLNSRYKFTVDLAASDANHLLPKYFTEERSAIDPLVDWGEGSGFCNCPYSLTYKFVQMATVQRIQSVFLIPARVDTRVWHDIVYKHANTVSFIKGRLHFYSNSIVAPYPCGMPLMLVEFSGLRPGYSPLITNLDPSRLPGWQEYKEEIKVQQKELKRG
jgi:phage N-6-adenine-methyltransferase